MRREHRDPYVVLGVGRQASGEEIAHAFRRAAWESHPDGGAAGSGSGERFQAVSDAYATLRDPRRRAAYDRAHPLVRRSPPSLAARRSVGYVAGGGVQVAVGSRLRVRSFLYASEVEVVPPASAAARSRPDPAGAGRAARLVLSLLRQIW